jgi:hypothetical protein
MNIVRPFIAVAVCSIAFSPVAPVRAEDAAKAGADTITKPEQALTDVPHPQLFALRPGPKQNDAITQITNLLHSNVQGKTGSFKIKVDRVETYRNQGEQADRYRLKAEDGHLVENGTNLKVFLWFHFEPSENAKVSGKKRGDELQLTGKITNASVSGGPNPGLHLDLDNVKVD